METTASLTQEKEKTTPAASIPDVKPISTLTELTGVVTLTGGVREQTTIHAPFTGEVLGAVPRCTEEDVNLALQRARSAQTAWAQTPMSQRKQIFLRYHDLVLARQEELLNLLQLEAGKSRLNAIDEVFDVAINSRHYAVRAGRYLRPRRRKGALPVLTSTFEVRHPVGVVGIVSPWNYPLVMAVSDAIPALLAGNTVVLKPSEETPFIALLAVSLLYEAGLPRDAMQVVTGKGRVIAPALIRGSDFLAFTGGTSTGRLLAAQAGEHLIKCSMELGGKNPAIVLDDADLNKAVTGVLRGCFASAGQLCVHTERIYVQSGIYDRFVPALAQRVKELTLTNKLEFSEGMGSLISQAQVDKATEHVQDALQKGAALLAGGKARPDLGPFFFEPTLFADVTPQMALYADETFGPVASVYRFDDVEDAIRMANDSSYGLNSSVWTRNPRRGREIARRLETGTANINEAFSASWGSVDAPMGGMKDSGLGRRHGADGILKYTEPQTIATQSVMLIGPNRLLPPERYAKVMTAVLKLMRWIPGWR